MGVRLGSYIVDDMRAKSTYEYILEVAEENKKEEEQDDKGLGIHPSEIVDQKMNFDELREINSDIIGIIKIPGTSIYYPICHTDNNTYYLTHTALKRYSRSGCIFMESENDTDFSDGVTYLYGHNMHNGTMFAELNNYLEDKYLKEHSKIYIYIEQATLTFEVTSVQVVEGSSEVEILKETSEKMIALVTCYTDNSFRTIIYGKLYNCTINFSK